MVDIKSVKDPQGFDAYRAKAPETVAQYGGEYVVVGGDAAVLEGDWQPGTLVVLRFPDRDRAEAWWRSQEYAPLKQLRQQASDSSFVVTTGLA